MAALTFPFPFIRPAVCLSSRIFLEYMIYYEDFDDVGKRLKINPRECENPGWPPSLS